MHHQKRSRNLNSRGNNNVPPFTKQCYYVKKKTITRNTIQISSTRHIHSYGSKCEKFFKDCTDEQILTYLVKKVCETVCILDIEDCVVKDVLRFIPSKRKLNDHELKMGITEVERQERIKKINELKEQIKPKPNGA